ncbi:MAG: hypothetical protein ACXAE3_00670 [Candidatus Kariarchaeaceae archaeon]|jgi:hypothetical protein
MYISARKFTREGRDRFGSSIFVNDLSEERVDSLEGNLRDSGILLAIFLLLGTKMLSANLLGILITLPLFVAIYFTALIRIKVTFTENRVLIERAYISPRLVKLYGYFLVGLAGAALIRFAFPTPLEGDMVRLSGMAWLFNIFGLYDTRFFLYRQIVLGNQFLYLGLDTLFTVTILLWFSVRFLTITYSFTEVNLSHVSEQLVKETANSSPLQLVSALLAFFALELTLFQGFTPILIILTILFIQYFPRSKQLNYTLVGPSNRDLVKNAILSEGQMNNLARITSITYGWEPQLDQYTRPYPENIVPKEVISVFETGLRSYSQKAYQQANILGLVFSVISNTFVILALIRFIRVNQIDEFDTLLVIIFILTITTVATFLGFTILNIFRARVKSNQQLMIGEGFIARYEKNSLWILKGSSLEGTTVQRGLSNSVIRYDKTKGLIIEWERFTLLAILGTIILTIMFWASIGAVNLRTIPLLFPSLINIGLEFLEGKAQAELEFFIITGFVLWGIIILMYPRYYARSRPTLSLDMQYASAEPIVLRDFDEHQEASILFTQSLINSSITSKKGNIGRPGSFKLRIAATGDVQGKYIRFLLGDTYREAEIPLPLNNESEILASFLVSGLKGYPEYRIIIELFDDNEMVIYTTMLQIQMFFESEQINVADFGKYGSLQLKTQITGQKA